MQYKCTYKSYKYIQLHVRYIYILYKYIHVLYTCICNIMAHDLFVPTYILYISMCILLRYLLLRLLFLPGLRLGGRGWGCGERGMPNSDAVVDALHIRLYDVYYTHTGTQRETQTRTLTHTYIYIHMHIYVITHTHTHTHTHSQTHSTPSLTYTLTNTFI